MTRPAASGLTLTELAARANGICAATLASRPPARGLGARPRLAAYRTAASTIDRQTKALVALKPTAGPTAAAWRAFTSAAVAVDRLARADETAAAGGRVPPTRDAGRIRLGRRLVATATKVGATGCIRG